MATMEPPLLNRDSASLPYVVWEVEGKPLTIHLEFDVVDRILLEVMRGFGAVPRRGAEVGGILIGSVESYGGRTLVRIEDFDSVACSYERGPSYLLSEGDRNAFETALERWRPGADRRVHAVGYFRSHTREELQLSEEDRALLDRYFPEEPAVALLIRPFATKVSMAGFFFRESGEFPSGPTYLEFPFRRRELRGGSPSAAEMPGRLEQLPEPEAAYSFDPVEAGEAEGPAPARQPTGSRFRGGYFWAPLSFIFLLLGVVLGVQATLSFRPAANTTVIPTADVYGLELSAVLSGDRVLVRWDRRAPAVQLARRGVLHIVDGPDRQSVELEAAQLQGGSAHYRHATGELTFRLEVFPRERSSVSESVEVRLQPAESSVQTAP